MSNARLALSAMLVVLGLVGCNEGTGETKDTTRVRTSTKKKRIEVPERHLASRPPDIPDVLPTPTEAQLRGLQSGVDALEEADAELRFIGALSAVTIVSKGRVPDQLAEDLLAYNGAPTKDRSAALRKAFEDSAWLFDEICGRSFDSVFAEGVSTGRRSEIARYVWTECRLERYSLLDGEQEFVESFDRTGPEPLLAHFIFAYLEQHGGAHPLEKHLLRELALGLPENLPELSGVEAWVQSH